MITNFKLKDYDVMVLDEFLGNVDPFADIEGFRCYENGIGTDAHSALEDLLESLSYSYDVTDLEGLIRSEWLPTSTEEGDCDHTYYCIRLLFNEDE
jgi:hypothetical protein